jgi:hypothetical protein
VFEEGFELPFGIHDKDKSERKEKSIKWKS